MIKKIGDKNKQIMYEDGLPDAIKINELTSERDEHRRVIENLTKLEPERKAFRLIGGVLVQRTVGEILPIVQTNFEGIKEIIVKKNKEK